MARARNLKPSFFLNDELATIDPLGRILFQGLWCLADRAGRLEDRPRRIKAEVLPYDDCNVDELLDMLTSKGFILRYGLGESRYIQVVNFEKHQNPHIKEAPSTIPAPEEHRACTVQAPEAHEASPADSPFPLPDSPIPDSGLQVARAPATRARDRGWEILSEFCGYEPRDPSERKLRNKVLNRLRTELHATDDEIEQACTNYVERWPEMERTAPSLSKHFEHMLRAPTRASPKRGGARNGEKNGNDWAREIAEAEARERQRGDETHNGRRGDLAELPAW